MLILKDNEHHLLPEDLIAACYKKAIFVSKHPELFELTVTDIDVLTEMFVELELEKCRRDTHNDQYLDYNDEIVEIIITNEEDDLMDITVSGDNLFYANGLLTKNSMGIIHTADLVLGLVRTEELDSMNQLMITQLKNRYSDPAANKRFIVGLNRAQMKLSDVKDGGSFTPDATDKRYEPKSKQAQQAQHTASQSKQLNQHSIDDMMVGMPMASPPKSINTQGFAF